MTLTLGNVGAMLGISATLIGGYIFDLGMRSDDHAELEAQVEVGDAEVEAYVAAGNVELDLRLTQLEIDGLRAIQERRVLTQDELDRLAVLEKRREILIEQQMKGV